MRRFRALLVLGALLLLAPPTLSSLAAGSNGAGYDLTWHTVDAGGRAVGSGYLMVSVVGQPDAGRLSGNGFTLAGGFLPSEARLRFVYLPVILRGQ